MAALFFFSTLSLNLLLNCALGMGELAARERSPRIRIYCPWFILFVSTALLWLFFDRLPFFSGSFDFVLIFPLSALSGLGLEKLLYRAVPWLGENPGAFVPGQAHGGLAAAALFLTRSFALSFSEALLLSAAFSGGSLAAFLIIKEIQKKSFLKIIPQGLRGKPVLLISMGLLSLIFSAAAVLFLTICV